MKRKFYITSIFVALVFSISHLYAQTSVCPTPSGLTSTNITSGSATLSWLASSTAGSYNVRYRVSGTAAWQSVTTTTTSVNLTGLASGATYEWQVQKACYNNNGTVSLSAFSASAYFTTIGSSAGCGVPNGLYANSITSTSASLHWNVTNASSYKIRYRETGTSTWTKTSSSSNSKNIAGLSSSTTYQWQVQSKCISPSGSYVLSAWSNKATFQTVGANTCPTPTGLTSTVSSSNAVALTWNSTGAVSYNIRYRSANSAAWTTATSSTNYYTISSVLSSATYEWQVQGVCQSVGVAMVSAWSAPAYFTTNSPIVTPNPADNSVTVKFESESQQAVNIIVRDFIGTPYSSEVKAASIGSNQYDIDVRNLKNGIYYMEISGSEKQVVKFYVQH